MSQDSGSKDPVKYMQAMLDLNPISSAAEIVDQRAFFLGLRKRIKPITEEEQLRRRTRCEEQINLARKEFWTTNSVKLQNILNGINASDFPDLSQALDRIRLVFSLRTEFESLNQHPAKVDNLFLALKRLVIVPPHKAGSIKESYLRKVADGANLKAIQKMAAVIRKEFPNLYRLEADFLDAVSKVKGRYVAPDSVSSGPMLDLEIPGWLIFVFLFILIRVVSVFVLRM